jgi:plastocyanin
MCGQTKAVNISILNTDNKPVANAAVWLSTESTDLMAPETLYAMRQENREFTPRVLIVPQNAKVRFPNADSIMHHVYSFSKAKMFELKLYKEQPKAPITFEQTGVVELGCNIHDWMLGYIVVVDSMLFGLTDENGQIEIPAASGDYTLNVWHSGFSDIGETESTLIKVADKKINYTLKNDINELIDFATDEFDDYE